MADVLKTISSAVNPCNIDGCYGSYVTSSNPKTVANRAPTTPTNFVPVDGTTSDDTTPTLSAKFSDPDGQTGHVSFSVYDEDTGLQVASGNGTTVSSGSSSTWTVPAGQIAAGTVDDWYAQSVDVSGATSANSPAITYANPDLKYTKSFYEQTINQKFLRKQGCAFAQSQPNTTNNGVVFLDFGVLRWDAANSRWAQVRAGHTTPRWPLGGTANHKDIITGLKKWSKGYHDCRPAGSIKRVTIVWGTNNGYLQNGLTAAKFNEGGVALANRVADYYDWVKGTAGDLDPLALDTSGRCFL